MQSHHLGLFFIKWRLDKIYLVDFKDFLFFVAGIILVY
jgi:hypothetical protein